MKPSEIFEGPNSSLRKAFDEAIKDIPRPEQRQTGRNLAHDQIAMNQQDTPQSDPVSDFFNAPEEVKRPVYEKALEKAQEEQSNTCEATSVSRFKNDQCDLRWQIQLKVLASVNMDSEGGIYIRDIKEIYDFISQLLEAEKKRWKSELEGMRTHFVPADNEWFGDEDYNEGKYKLVPAKDPQKAMYCLTCGRFLHEEGCTCGTVTIDAVLQKLS